MLITAYNVFQVVVGPNWDDVCDVNDWIGDNIHNDVFDCLEKYNLKHKDLFINSNDETVIVFETEEDMTAFKLAFG